MVPVLNKQVCRTHYDEKYTNCSQSRKGGEAAVEHLVDFDHFHLSALSLEHFCMILRMLIQKKLLSLKHVSSSFKGE